MTAPMSSGTTTPCRKRCDAAQGIACDAAVTPVVVGDVNPDALDDLVRLCVQLDKLRHGTPQHQETEDSADGAEGSGPEVPAAFGGGRSREALEQAVIGKTMIFLLHSYSAFDLR
jgi:hypothetical protein